PALQIDNADRTMRTVPHAGQSLPVAREGRGGADGVRARFVSPCLLAGGAVEPIPLVSAGDHLLPVGGESERVAGLVIPPVPCAAFPCALVRQIGMARLPARAKRLPVRREAQPPVPSRAADYLLPLAVLQVHNPYPPPVIRRPPRQPLPVRAQSRRSPPA